ncbi:MAG: Cna B-type domain-containing protein [Lachnospiraceae bacterium]|nr:Cna B-type domain-containing protein [Lachnospiraceae bacterium]
MKRLTGIIMSFLMIFIMIFQGLNLTVYADGLAVDARITSFQILNTSNQPVTETEKSATLKLDFNFEMPESIFLDNGNYFDIKIPEEFDLTTAVTYPTTFDIKDENGTVVGTATIQPNAATATGGGGNVHVVFNENATGKYKFKGHLHFDLKINKKRVGDNRTINVKAGVNNREDLTPGPKPIIVKPDRALSTVEVIGKWAKAPTVPNQAAWGVRVNRTKQYLKNVVITDKITSNNGHFIDPDSLPTVITSENFKLMKCEYNASGNPTSYTGEVVDISDKITFNEDKTEFRLDLGDIGTQSYFLSYKSTVEYGDIVQSNNATLTSSTNPTQSSSGTWKYRHSGGAAGGVLGKKLKLRKVDVDNGAPLAGATFKVTKSDGTSFNLTTSADGTAISDQLMQGRYKVKEINAPEGYELDPNEYSVYVYDDVGGTLTIKDKMDKTYVKVSKEWVGPKGSSATIHLWADGVDTGKSVTLNERNNWQHTFEGLKKKNTDGSEIQYTVKEDAITNYDSSITGDMENGFTVTNTNTEKISVPVKKVWVGKEADSVTIKLLADGTEKESVTLTKDDNWEHTFSNLPKYADDGHEIEYTVDEVHIDDYSTTISGTAATGFNITNTILITPVPPVTPTPVAPSPINPISPVTPVTPINPVNPITPSPISPITPVSPSPINPISPVTPVTPINPVNPITPSPISPITPVSPSPINPISPVTPVTPINPVNPITPSPISPITPVSPSPINPISPVTPITPINPVNPITPSQITPSRIATPSQIITPGRDQDPVSRPNRPIATPSIATGSNTRGGGSSGGNSDVRPTKTVTVTDTNSKDAIQKPEIVVDEPKISNRNPQPDKNELKKDIKSSISATRRAMSVPKTSDRKDVRGYMFIFISSLAAAVIFWKKKETK